MNKTDETIEVTCSECEAIVTGEKAMVQHILLDHANVYSTNDAYVFAALWTEDAHKRSEEADANYNESKALDDAIDRDIEAVKEAR